MLRMRQSCSTGDDQEDVRRRLGDVHRLAPRLLSAVLDSIRCRILPGKQASLPTMRSFSSDVMKPIAIACFAGYCVWNSYCLASGRIPDSIFHVVTGYPCPTTGGIRSFAAYLQGDWRMGFWYNPFTPVFIVLCCVSVVVLGLRARKRTSVVLPQWLYQAWVCSLLMAWAAKFLISPEWW